MKPYSAIIIGCGKIAGGYDKPGSEVILTHAHAISKSQKISLVAMYDVNIRTAREMAIKWNTMACDSIPEIFEKANPDIVTIAVPDEFHEEMLETVLQFSPRLIICEKPLGRDLNKLKHLIQKSKRGNTKVAVNYRRNYDQRIVQLKKEIQQNLFGEFLNGVFFYSKGFRHNGSHAISLLRYLFGEIQEFQILDSRIDYKADDPSLDLRIQFGNGKKCYLLAGDETKYSIFEWEFLFSKVRLLFKKEGFYLCRQRVIDDELFPGYKTLEEEQCEETGLKNSMAMLYENALSSLETEEALLCTAEDAFTTQSVIEAILNDFHNN